MSDNISYYIDELGQSIPISDHYTARLIIVTGQIERNQHQDISRFVNAIICDTFWNSQLTQIDYINNEYVLVPSVGNHKIYFGLLENIDEKLDNLYQLYRQILPIKGWQTYSKINLKFKDQIICTKR